MGEKMDGHRKYWPGGRGKHIYNWRGNFSKIKLPEEWAEQMPPRPLEFEVVHNSDGRHTSMKEEGVLSKDTIMYIFDMPSSKKPYRERWKDINQLKLPPFMSIVPSYDNIN